VRLAFFERITRYHLLRSLSVQNFLWELVHTDVCGPINISSVGGNKYFLTFNDDFSRKICIYLLKSKDEVFHYFKIFKAFVERESGRQIKMVRSDGGGEYKSNEFKRHYEELGLQHNITCPYTPQHNRVAKRKNRTIMDMARNMLETKGMPNYFWVEVVTCAVYLINKSYPLGVFLTQLRLRHGVDSNPMCNT